LQALKNKNNGIVEIEYSVIPIFVEMKIVCSKIHGVESKIEERDVNS
jgi:hypothetical protein